MYSVAYTFTHCVLFQNNDPRLVIGFMSDPMITVFLLENPYGGQYQTLYVLLRTTPQLSVPNFPFSLRSSYGVLCRSILVLIWVRGPFTVGRGSLCIVSSLPTHTSFHSKYLSPSPHLPVSLRHLSSRLVICPLCSGTMSHTFPPMWMLCIY